MGNFKKDLSIACGTDDLRPIFQYVIFENGYAICSDATIVVKHNLLNYDFTEEEIELLNGKCLHKETFKEISRYDYIEIEEDKLNCLKHNVKTTFYLKDLQDIGKYPNIKAVINDKIDSEKIENIGISLKLINKIQKLSLTEDKGKGFDMKFNGKNKIILIKGIGLTWEEETFGLMPKLLD